MKQDNSLTTAPVLPETRKLLKAHKQKTGMAIYMFLRDAVNEKLAKEQASQA